MRTSAAAPGDLLEGLVREVDRRADHGDLEDVDAEDEADDEEDHADHGDDGLHQRRHEDLRLEGLDDGAEVRVGEVAAAAVGLANGNVGRGRHGDRHQFFVWR